MKLNSKFVAICSDNGTPYNVRVVPPHGHYGAGMSLLNSKAAANGVVYPLVEFYDTRAQFDYDFVGSRESAKLAGADCLGQFVSRYRLDTLLGIVQDTKGLALHGGVAAWSIDGESLRRALIMLELWQPTQKPRLVIVWDSSDASVQPALWMPKSVAIDYAVEVLDKGHKSKPDTAECALLESGCNDRYPNYTHVK